MDVTPPDHVQFHYKKSRSYRVVHADGAWGGLTPKLDIFVSFFSERPPIPKRIVQSLEPSGRLGGELDRAVKDGIIREVEVGMIIDEGTARSLIDWLSTQLESLKEIKEKVRAKSSDNVPDDTRLH